MFTQLQELTLFWCYHNTLDFSVNIESGEEGEGENTSFLRVIAFMSQEFWPGLSENLFGRKVNFKLYETCRKVADSLA